MRFHCATGPFKEVGEEEVEEKVEKDNRKRKERREKKGLRRESNPGHPHPKRVFYHLTTKPTK